MLDENLPTFSLAESTDRVKHHATFYVSSGFEHQLAYSLHHADPASESSENCYAVALLDPYNPEVIYGEILLKPDWTSPSLSQDEIRRNGGIPPLPEPVTPHELTIQLYNPDYQIVVTHKPGSLVGSPRWDFSLPQNTFRTPSASLLDRSQHDPAVSGTTARINFSWKKESKLSKEMTCYMTGKSTDALGRKRSKEPDITVALLKSLREITIYEPNLNRVELDDTKGLEVALLLGAAAIRDVWFGNLRQVFHISDPGRNGNGDGRDTVGQESRVPASTQSPPLPPRDTSSTMKPLAKPSGAALGALNQQPLSGSLQDFSGVHQNMPRREPSSPPITDPRKQWQIDAVTARLKQQVETEERERRRVDEARRHQQEIADEEETKRLRKMVEAEAKEARRRQKQVEKESERLRREYGEQSSGAPSMVPQVYSAPLPQGPFPARPHSAQGYHNQPQQPQQPWPQYPQTQTPLNGPYMTPATANVQTSHVSFLPGLSNDWRPRWNAPIRRNQLVKKISSVW